MRRSCVFLVCAVFAAVTAEATLEPFSVSGDFRLVTASARIDGDFDGMPDEYERLYGTDVFRNDAAEDADGDGATNLEEYNAGTDPLEPALPGASAGVSPFFVVSTRVSVADSDQDGLPDWWEGNFGFGPTGHGPDDDPDHDGHNNFDEFNKGSNPLSAENHALSASSSRPFVVVTRLFEAEFTLDSDNDGLPDWWETKYDLNVAANDSMTDFDLDGVVAFDEFRTGSNPQVSDSLIERYGSSGTFLLRTSLAREDTDGDGIPDAWESLHGLNRFAVDANEDADGDGLTNLQEYNAGRDPHEAELYALAQRSSGNFGVDTGGMRASYWQDSDAEGIPDWWELRYGLEVDRDDGFENPDGDLLVNVQEFRFGMHPRIYDSQRPEDMQSASFPVDTGGSPDQDRDGLPDAWERLYFGGLDHRSSEDSDNDGVSNFEEFHAGTDPTSLTSALRGTVSVEDEGIVIKWATVPGRIYRLYAMEEVNGGSQRVLVTEIEARLLTETHIVQPTAAHRFFVIEVR